MQNFCPRRVGAAFSNPLLRGLVPFYHKADAREWLLRLAHSRNPRNHRSFEMSDKLRDDASGHTHQGAEPGRISGDRKANPKTEGTNRDCDDSRESTNQGHGHPREERGHRD